MKKEDKKSRPTRSIAPTAFIQAKGNRRGFAGAQKTTAFFKPAVQKKTNDESATKDVPAYEAENKEFGEKILPNNDTTLISGRHIIAQKKEQPVQMTAAAYKNEVEIRALTLEQFYEYTHSQADWHIRTPTADLSVALRTQLRKVQQFAEGNRILDGCGGMKIQDILNAGSTDSNFRKLSKYNQGVTQDPHTVQLPVITDVAIAINQGDAILKLETVLTGDVLYLTLKEVDLGQLTQLINRNYVDDFVRYMKTCKAYIEASDGSDFASYLLMRNNDGVNPISYHGTLAHIKNFHRFEKKLLDKLKTNESAGNKAAKPLTLILHTSLDHNGAFHRDPFLWGVVNDARNFTIMVEGAETLDSISDMLPDIAARYGVRNKIAQVMIAGHGNATFMELAGHTTGNIVGTDGQESVETVRDDLTADVNNTASTRLMNTLLANMDNNPNARIALNACLTGSDIVTQDLDADPAVARQQINDAIRNNPGLRTRFQQVAAAAGNSASIIGANGSFGQVSLIDPATGLLRIQSTGHDPQLTASPIEYVRAGTEPTGVLRATVRCWAEDQAACIAAVQEHYNNCPNNYDGQLIHAMFEIILANRDNGQLINRLAHAVDLLAEFHIENEYNNVDNLIAEYNRLGRAHLDTIYRYITPHISNLKKLIIAQEKMHTTPSATNDSGFLTALDGLGVARTNEPYVNITTINADLTRLLPRPPADPQKNAKIKLAAIGVMKGNNHPGDACYEFLRSLLPAGQRTFSATDNVGGLTGYSERTLLNAIGMSEDVVLPPAAGGGPTTPTPNVDLNGDGTNDFYINTHAARAFTTASVLNVREKPGMGERVIGRLAQNTQVQVIGDSGDWYAIRFRQGVAFISKTYSNLRPL